MGYEKEVLTRARRRYEEQVQRRSQLHRQRRDRLWTERPRLKEIDMELQRSVASTMAYAYRSGTDPKEAIRAIGEKNLRLQQERAMILRNAGYSPDYLLDGPACRKCGDTGYIGTQMCACLEKLCLEEQRSELSNLMSARVSSFDDFSLSWYPDEPEENWDVTPRQQMELVYEICVNYANKFNRHSKSLLMNGGTGLGKTFLSGCIAQQVVSKGFSVVYDTAIHVFSCMEKQKFGGADEEELRMCRRVQECDLLILDDLGTEMQTAFSTSALYNIINGRLLSEAPTIISTNMSLGELSRRYTPQIASRLMGEYINLVFRGQDIRLLKANQA